MANCIVLCYTLTMATKNIQIRLDVGLKQNAESVLDELGLDMPTAFRLFLKKVVKTRSIPFRISAEEEEGEVFTAAQIRGILSSREEARDPAVLNGPFKTQAETQEFLDSLKQK